jgi:hypothetical protein
MANKSNVLANPETSVIVYIMVSLLELLLAPKYFLVAGCLISLNSVSLHKEGTEYMVIYFDNEQIKTVGVSSSDCLR